MLFMFKLVVQDNDQLVTSVTYPVDLLRGHLVNARTLYDAALNNFSPVGDYLLPYTGAPVPKEIWPFVAGRLKHWNFRIQDKVKWISVLSARGKRFQVSITLHRIIPPRPAQS